VIVGGMGVLVHVVQVPGGRRVRLTPEGSETFGDLLASCCRAFGGLDASKWMLRREARKGLGGQAQAQAPLDHGMPLRLGGLAAGATLEMVPRVAARAGPVKVAVLVAPTGDNVVGTVPSDGTLWDGLVLVGALPADADGSPGAELQPVLRYVQREVKYSRALKATTWAGVGVAAGDAVRVTLDFRVLSPEDRVEEFQRAEAAAAEAAEAAAAEAAAAAGGDTASAERPGARGAGPPRTSQAGASFAGMFTKPDAQVREEEAARARAAEVAGARGGDGTVERDLRVFVRPAERVGNGPAGVASEDVDDSFYEVTAADVAASLASAKAREDDQILKTQAMRDREKERRVGLIKKVVVRVHLPDNTTVLQANFAPRDKVGVLAGAVREALADEGRPFSLDVRAPHKRLEGAELDKTFYDAGLAPAANVWLSWAASGGEGAKEGLGALKEELAGTAVGMDQAEKYSAIDVEAMQAQMQKRIDAVKLPKEVAYENYQSGTGPSTSTTAKKMPKWFKGT